MAQARIVRASAGETAKGGDIPWTFKSGGRVGDGFDFMIGEVPYFSGPPLHVHRAQSDTFYVLDNVLKLQVGDDFFDLEPGDYASVPPGVRHTFDNVRRNQPPVRAVNLMVPGGLDLFLADLGALGEAPAGAELNRVAQENGVTFVGPPLRVPLGVAQA
jgi:quercetin dioxygenase-like cupin family protein